MDHMRIIRRSFEITWFYRALWVFGFILALTTPSGGGGNGGGGSAGGGSSFTAPAGLASTGQMPFFQIEQGGIAALIAAAVALSLVLAVIFTIARVVAETSLIRMVADHEDTGLRRSVSHGFRLGWTRAALRIFLIDLVAVFGAMFIFLLLAAITLLPLLAWAGDNDTLGAIGTALAVALGIPSLLAFIVFAIGLSVVVQFVHRAAVLEGLGVFAAFRRGWQVARRRLGDTLIMAVLLFALGLAAGLVILPIVLLLGVVGLGISGIPAALAALVSSAFVQGEAAWIIAALVGVPIFLLVVLLPLIFLGGLAQVFTSSAWTLTYREMLALDVARTEALGPAAGV